MQVRKNIFKTKNIIKELQNCDYIVTIVVIIIIVIKEIRYKFQTKTG